MANEEHVALLKEGVRGWNEWRKSNPWLRPDLSSASLEGIDLREADLSFCNLIDTDMRGVDFSNSLLIEAHFDGAGLDGCIFGDATLLRGFFRWAKLDGAHISDANLTTANFAQASLRGAKLWHSTLDKTNFSQADLTEADFSGARLHQTIFGATTLHKAQNLENCLHYGPSVLDHQTLGTNPDLPLGFLRGCGLSDQLIDFLPSLLNRPIQFHSCFISYSSKDHAFADRLFADLQNKGIRCWFAPEDMKIGDKIRRRIDEMIHVHERLLLILSENSVSSEWVEKEVETAFEKERQEKREVLFPVRLDDAVMESQTGWAADIRRSRHIGDFTCWKDHEAFRRAFDRVVRDLRADGGTKS